MTAQNMTVAEIAANSLAAVRIFERLGIDYCCGGKRPLDEACARKGLDASDVLLAIETAMSEKTADSRDWTTAPLRELISHIVGTHHEYLKRELEPLQARIEKVYRVYNEKYGPTLKGLPEVYSALRSELELHLRKEEMILFPVIEAYEGAADAGRPIPAAPFGTVNNPIRMMEHEHDSAGQALARIRAITNDFEIPEYACATYRSMTGALRELEQDLHMHIHLENNVLFPRAAALEAAG